MQKSIETTIVTGISALTPAPRAWICDIWGVVHNGVASFPAAVDACVRFRERGGRIVLVSNAPRPSGSVVKQLESLAVPVTAYDAVLTSGDVTRDALLNWIGTTTLHIGPERDLSLFAGLDIPLVEIASAERILCSGLYDDTRETPEDYRRLLQIAAAQALPMLCANPDIKVDRGGKIVYCAGAVAQLYEELGGSVEYAGKPYPPIYAMAHRLLAEMDGDEPAPGDVLAIGDGVHTDIAGGLRAGLRTVYVSSAIHLDGPFDAAALERLFPDPCERPHFAMPALAW
jgi:HAD superfamily hydrolase (TIGR01459 family)